MGKKSTVELARQMYDFYGPVDFVKMGTRYALTKVEGLVPRSFSGNGTSSLTRLCEGYDVPVTREQRINSEAFPFQGEVTEP